MAEPTTPTLADLAEVNPGLARGLTQLLEYDGDDIADVFCWRFCVEYDGMMLASVLPTD
jgi:hypothetical protein